MSSQYLHTSVLLIALAATSATVHTRDAVAQSHHPCASVIDPAARLDCYDSAFPPSANALTRGEAARVQAVQDFGLAETQPQAKAAERGQASTPDRIEAGVVKVREHANRRRVVTLDNGQVWVLTENTLRGSIKRGDRVVVRNAALGSFMLITTAGVPLRARRLQ